MPQCAAFESSSTQSSPQAVWPAGQSPLGVAVLAVLPELPPSLTVDAAAPLGGDELHATPNPTASRKVAGAIAWVRVSERLGLDMRFLLHLLWIGVPAARGRDHLNSIRYSPIAGGAIAARLGTRTPHIGWVGSLPTPLESCRDSVLAVKSPPSMGSQQSRDASTGVLDRGLIRMRGRGRAGPGAHRTRARPFGWQRASHLRESRVRQSQACQAVILVVAVPSSRSPVKEAVIDPVEYRFTRHADPSPRASGAATPVDRMWASDTHPRPDLQPHWKDCSPGSTRRVH